MQAFVLLTVVLLVVSAFAAFIKAIGHAAYSWWWVGGPALIAFIMVLFCATIAIWCGESRGY